MYCGEFYRNYNEQITTVEYTGKDKNTKQEMCYVLSTVKIDIEVTYAKILMFVKQSCRYKDYERYNKVIHDNLKNVSYNIYEDDWEYEIEDKKLGKIVINNKGEITGKKVNINYKTNKFKIPISISFDSRIVGFNKTDFIEKKEAYINNLNAFMDEKLKVKKAVVPELIDWFGEPIEVLANRYKNIEIFIECEVGLDKEINISSGFSAEEEEFACEGYIDMVFNCETKEIVIYEIGTF